MKQIINFLQESIFDIDDNSIINKKGFDIQIKYGDSYIENNLKSGKYGIDIETLTDALSYIKTLINDNKIRFVLKPGSFMPDKELYMFTIQVYSEKEYICLLRYKYYKKENNKQIVFAYINFPHSEDIKQIIDDNQDEINKILNKK